MTIIDTQQRLANQAANKRLIRECGSPDSLVLKHSAMADLIQGSVKEHCAFNKILTPREVDTTELEVGREDDALYFRIHLSPNTYAHASSFGAAPKYENRFRMDRVFGTFHLLQTPVTEINEYYASTYPFAIAPMIEKNVPVDFGEARDFVMLRDLESVIQSGRETFNNVFKGSGTAGIAIGTATRVNATPTDLTTFKRRFTNNRSGGLKKVLATEYDFVGFELAGITEMGDNLTSEVFVKGYMNDTIRGVEFIRTIKSDPTGDVFRDGNMYGFGSEDELGRNYDYQGIKTDLRKEYQFIKFSARMAFGSLWVGSDRIQKCELYQSGTTTAGATITGRASDTSTNPQYNLGKSDEYWQDMELVGEHLYHSLEQTPIAPSIVMN